MHTASALSPISAGEVGPSPASLSFVPSSSPHDLFPSSTDFDMDFTTSALSTGSTQTLGSVPMGPNDPLLREHSMPKMVPVHPSTTFHNAPSLPTSLPMTSLPSYAMGPTQLALHSHIRLLKRRGRRMLRELQNLQQQIELAERELWLAGNFGA